MIGRPRLKIDTGEFATMYNSGVKIVDITKHFGISKSSAHKIRTELKIPVRRWRVKFDENKYRWLFAEGVAYPMMAQKLGISKCVVMEIRKRLGLPARKRGQKRIRG